VDTGQEIAIGRQQYEPSQQMQGGEYVLDPELQAYVSRVGQRLAAESDRDLPYEFVVLNSSVPNAWALPGGKIAVNRGLISELDSEAELAAVLGHEIVHAAARHGARSMERGMLTQGALAAAAIAISSSDYGEYTDYALGAASVGAQLIQTKYGRDAERESDRYGMVYMKEAGYDPAAAVDLQETFVRLSEGRRSDWLSGLFASHPPSTERVENNRAFADELGRGGELGREAYARATADLRARQPAYDAADEGGRALAQKDWDTALAKAREAIDIEPDESRFHALAGQAHLGAGRTERALQAFDRAVELDDGYYANWQARGMANLRLERLDAAQRDFNRASELLPTAESANALGQIALREGRTDAAREHLSRAAQAQSPSGQQARASLARLDLPEAPERWIEARWGVSDGVILAELSNGAPIDVADLVLRVRVRDAQGNVGGRDLPLDGTLAAGGTTRVRTGVALPEGAGRDDVAVSVVRARAAE
jgi:predicted Zn-dependent protease